MHVCPLFGHWHLQVTSKPATNDILKSARNWLGVTVLFVVIDLFDFCGVVIYFRFCEVIFFWIFIVFDFVKSFNKVSVIDICDFGEELVMFLWSCLNVTELFDCEIV